MIRWFVAKYMPDLRRREPMNIGVVLVSGDGRVWMRFLGERRDGMLDGRRLPKDIRSLDNFKAWYAYWRALASGSASWDELVRETRGNSPANYFLEVGGEAVQTERTAVEMLSHLFETLVARESEVVPMAPADELIDRLGVVVEREVRVPVPLGAGTEEVDEVFFDYRHRNGADTLMRAVRLGRGKRIWERLHAAKYGFDLVAKAALGAPVALVDTRGEVQPGQIRILRDSCEVIDVADPDRAEDALRALLHLPGRRPSGGATAPSA